MQCHIFIWILWCRSSRMLVTVTSFVDKLSRDILGFSCWKEGQWTWYSRNFGKLRIELWKLLTHTHHVYIFSLWNYRAICIEVASSHHALNWYKYVIGLHYRTISSLLLSVFPTPCHLSSKGPCDEDVLIHFVHVYKKYKTRVGDQRWLDLAFAEY